eukprot:516378-Amphidinium_carterae.2
MADHPHWVPTDTGWRQGEQCFTWDEATYKVKWDSALQLCKEVSDSRPDFEGLDSGLATQTLRQLKLDGQSQKDSVKSALNAALGGVWHEVRANSVFEVGEMCVRCGEAVEDVEHSVHHCPAWVAERREVELPALCQASWFAPCSEKAGGS